MKYTDGLSALCNVSLCDIAGLASFFNYLLQFFLLNIVFFSIKVLFFNFFLP